METVERKEKVNMILHVPLKVQKLAITRHAPSIANDAYAASDEGDHEPMIALREIAEEQIPLADHAPPSIKRAREWLTARFSKPFHAHYVSKMLRSTQTADLLDPAATWTTDSRLNERTWGEFGTMPRHEKNAHDPTWKRRKDYDPWNFAPPFGGESPHTKVERDVLPFLKMLNEKHAGEHVWIVGHGEVTLFMRALIEGIPPHKFGEFEKPRRMDNLETVVYKRKEEGISVQKHNPLKDVWSSAKIVVPHQAVAA